MKTTRLTLIVIVVFSFSYCGLDVKNQSKQANNEASSQVIDTIIKSTPFLNNTTYTYTGSVHPNSVKLIDLSYTPQAEYKLNKILLKLNLDTKTAIVTTDVAIKHKIKSIEYIKLTQYHKGNDIVEGIDDSKPSTAVITTNKGKITITEPDINNDSKNEYNIVVEYGNFIAGDFIQIMDVIAQRKGIVKH